jgi:hypothetical protein
MFDTNHSLIRVTEINIVGEVTSRVACVVRGGGWLFASVRADSSFNLSLRSFSQLLLRVYVLKNFISGICGVIEV